MIFEFRDIREFKNWIASNFFNFYWQKYQRDYLNVVDRDKIRKEQLRIVIARIVERKKNKQQKFFIKTSKKTLWNNVDHKALLVHDVKKKNCAIFELFYEKALSKFEIEIMMWNIIDYVMMKFASSKKNKKIVKTIKVITLIETSDQHMTLKFDLIFFFSQKQIVDFEIDFVELFVENMIRKATRNYVVAQKIMRIAVDMNVVKKSFRENLDLSFNESNDSNEFDSSSSMKKKKQQSSQFDNQWILRKSFRFVSLDNLTKSRLFRQLMSFSSIIAFDDDRLITTTKRFHNLALEFWNNQSNIRRNQTLSFEKQSLINAQRMMRECQSKTLDLDERVWKCWVIEKIIKNRENVVKFQKSIIKYLNVVYFFKEKVKLWYSFMKKSTDTDLLVLIKFDEIKIANFDKMKEWLKSQNYEKNNLKKSCQRLRIFWRELNQIVYRIDDMTINTQFR